MPSRSSRFDGVVFFGERQTVDWSPTPPPPRPRPPSLRTPEPEPELTGRFGELFRSLCADRGLAADRYRPRAMRRRERACLRVVGDAAAALQPALAERALSAVLIGVTSFFRDERAFADLRREVAALRTRPRLDVVSLACSDGCELYSAGMVLGDLGLLDRATLSGVDCRASAIERARAGTYPEAVMTSVDAAARARWFEPATGGSWRVRKELRGRSQWSVGDAFAPAPPHSADLVLCRNLAIYLRPAAAADLWRGIAARLRPGALLMVGKAERPLEAANLVRVGHGLYRVAETAP